MSIEISRFTRCWFGLLASAFAWILTLGTSTQAQIVQIPSMGTFNISSSASVPDQGSAFLGGNRTAVGSSARGTVGRDRSSASVSASTTVIDLDELDRMIRSPRQWLWQHPPRHGQRGDELLSESCELGSATRTLGFGRNLLPPGLEEPSSVASRQRTAVPRKIQGRSVQGEGSV